MAYFAFRLDNIKVRFQRGKIPDNDLISFAVLINQQDRGHRTFVTGALISGSDLPFPNDARIPRGIPVMFVGPFDFRASDGITVVFSGMNLSDSQIQLDAQKMDVIETKILSAMTGAAVTALVGTLVPDLADISKAVASALSGALGVIGDPVGTLLGVKPDGPCNGLVFSDGIQYNADALSSLSYDTRSSKGYATCPFTRSYTDAATHDAGICGHVAETDITWSVLRFDTLSVREWGDLFFVHTRLDQGLRQLGVAAQPTRIRAVFVH